MSEILALDLARRTGFAFGGIRGKPQSGSILLTRSGADMCHVFANCRKWLSLFLDEHPTIKLVVFEAPMVPHHIKEPRRPETARQLIGLAAVVEELLCTRGGYDVREATVAQVREHFLGSNRHRREAAKLLTIEQCKLLGWNPVDDNAADACALWDYQRSIIINENLRVRAGA